MIKGMPAVKQGTIEFVVYEELDEHGSNPSTTLWAVYVEFKDWKGHMESRRKIFTCNSRHEVLTRALPHILDATEF